MIDRPAALTRLTGVFHDAFQDEAIQINEASTSDDIPGWDSLTHLLLVLALEKEFGVKLSAEEIGDLANVGQMLDLLTQRATK